MCNKNASLNYLEVTLRYSNIFINSSKMLTDRCKFQARNILYNAGMDALVVCEDVTSFPLSENVRHSSRNELLEH